MEVPVKRTHVEVPVVTITAIAIILIFVWRRLSARPAIQKHIHRLPSPFPFLLQWYCCMLMLLSPVLLRSTWRLWSVISLDMLSPARLQENIAHQIQNGNIDEETAKMLGVPQYLRFFVVLSAAISIGTFGVLVGQIAWSANRNYDSDDKWQAVGREDMKMMIIALPAVFVVLSMQRSNRVLRVLGGYDTGKATTHDLALYDADGGLADICQYIVVYFFTKLCMSCVKQHQDMPKAAKYLMFQGVYGWVFVGLIQSSMAFEKLYLENAEAYGFKIGKKEDPYDIELFQIVKGRIDFTFLFFTMLCILNMHFVCELKTVTDVLGNANQKFLATRVLLICSSAQPKVIDFVVSKHRARINLFSQYMLNDMQGKLLHSSLLTIECLAVVLFNVYAWENNVNEKEMHDALESAQSDDSDDSSAKGLEHGIR